MDAANKQIEQQLTVLLRRVQRIHLSTGTGDVNLERSAYGIMCKLADEGPQRLGALATRSASTPRRSPVRCRRSSRSGSPPAAPTPPTGAPRSSTSPTPDARSSTAPGPVVAAGSRRRWPSGPRRTHPFGRLLGQFNASVEVLLGDRDGPAAPRHDPASW